jgi:hypothetical protein
MSKGEVECSMQDLGEVIIKVKISTQSANSLVSGINGGRLWLARLWCPRAVITFLTQKQAMPGSGALL